MAPLFGEDLEVGALAPLLDALSVESAEFASGWGWQYYTSTILPKFSSLLVLIG